MDPIKEAFAKAKQDIFELSSQISSIKKDIEEIKRTLKGVRNPADILNNSTDQQINKTDTQQDIRKEVLYGLKSQYNELSIRNEGVPTDRQTNRQTNQHTSSKLADAVETFEFLTQNLKKSFLGLTKQEREVFLLIYDLEDHGFIVDYSLLAQKLKLTESSIRDYVLRIINKGIPLQKHKENNKKVILSIASELKKLASRESIKNLYFSN